MKEINDNEIDNLLARLILALETEENIEFKDIFIKVVEAICDKKVNSMMMLDNRKKTDMKYENFNTLTLGDK